MIIKLRVLATGFLTRVGKYVKIDLRYVFKNGSWILAGQIVSSLTVFILSIGFANLLSAETYGTYKYLLSVAALLAIFSLPGMVTALTRSVASGFSSSFFSTTIERVRWGFLGTTIGLLVATYFYSIGSTQMAIGIVLVSLFVPLFDVFNTYTAYLQGKKDFKSYALLGALVQVGATTAILFAVLFTDNLFILLCSYLIPYTLLRFACWLYIRSKIDITHQQKDATVISYGKHLSIMNSVSQVASQADQLLLFAFLGPIQIAGYAIAIAPAEQIKHFLGGVNTLLLPRFSNYSQSEIKKNLIYKGLLLLLVTASIVAVYILSAPTLFAIIFPQYTEYVFFSQIFSLSLLNVFFVPCLIFLQAHGHIKAQYYINTITSVLQIVFMTVGIIFYGLVGLVVARIVTRFITGLVSFFYAFRVSAT